MGLAGKMREKIPRRGILGAMMFLACMFSYVIRTNLSIIIVAMVTNKKGGGRGIYCEAHPNTTVVNTTVTSWDNGTLTAIANISETANTTDTWNAIVNATIGHNATANLTTTVVNQLPDYGERFDWNEHVQSIILASYFVGVLPSSIPAGMLAEKFGGSRVVAFATLIPALLNLLMPWASGINYWLVIVLRFLMGFCGSAVYPALHAMIARWVPPGEKGMFVWTMQGGPFGTVVTFTICGQIISAIGWKAAYYITSGLMLVFYALWVYLIYDTPEAHPGITEEEKLYIREQIGTTVSKQKNKLPVVAIITSVPFLVLLWAHFANMWGIYFISTNGPKYTLQVLGLDMNSGGFITGLPYIARLGAGVLFAAAGDYARKKNYLTVIWLRKSFTLFSHLAPAICLIGMTYAGCDAILAISMLILALGFNGAACQTSLQNHQDLAPNFAGSLYGVMNTVGSFPGFIIPPIIGALTNDKNGVGEWRPMFWISAGVFISATVLFFLFGSADIQPWNDLNKGGVEDPTEEEKRLSNGTKEAQALRENEEEENAHL